MAMILQKGLDYHATYSSLDYPVLSADWAGSVSFYSTYPGTAVFTKALTVVGNEFYLDLTIGEILNLVDGLYSAVATFANDTIDAEMSNLEYATVYPVLISASPMCKIFGTIEKIDGTPVGIPISEIANTSNGLGISTTWKGVTIKVSIKTADADSGKVVGIDSIETTTSAAGYFEVYVLQGLAATVTCASFGKTIEISTTGISSIDISTYF